MLSCLFKRNVFLSAESALSAARLKPASTESNSGTPATTITFLHSVGIG